MYATPGQVDREQYLLGKAIDKHVDPLQNGDQEVTIIFIVKIFYYFFVIEISI